jgi:hypothetical protein
MPQCGSCHREIQVCDVCGGLLCAPGCADRAEDGCSCADDDMTDDDDDGTDEW